MNIIRQKLKKLTPVDYAAFGLIAASFIYLLYIAFYDGTISDEAFYITIPMRLINGDGLFTDEWHLSQLSAVLTYIPVKLFYVITGGTQGIILYMRLLFCFMQTFTGAVLYKTLKKDGFIAILISISFMLFSIIALHTLSYNTMGAALLVLLICTVYSLDRKPSLIKMLLSGSLIAMFILCQPTGLVFYGIYFIAFCVFLILHKNGKVPELPYAFLPKSFLMTIAGILPVLCFFIWLLLKNSDIATVINCIPGILNDVEHMKISESMGIETFSFLQFFSDMTMAAGTVMLIILAVCIIISVIIRRHSRSLAIIITSAGVVVFVLVLLYRLLFAGGKTETDDINFIFLPLALAGLSFFFLQEKRNLRPFILFWCTGFTYALLMTVSSNLRLHASVNGYIIAAMGTLIFTKNISAEIKASETKALLKKAAAVHLAAFTAVLSLFCFSFAVAPFISANEYTHTEMTDGIYKGVHLPSDQALAYTRLRKDAEEISGIISPEDKIFVSENIPSVYLEGNFNMGAFSGWFIQEQLAFPEIRERFRSYYKIFPENIPDYIYVPSYIYGEFGIEPIPAKKTAIFAYALFEGITEETGNGLLIKVTGIKDEQN